MHQGSTGRATQSWMSRSTELQPAPPIKIARAIPISARLKIISASLPDVLDAYPIQAHTWTTATFCAANQQTTLAQ